MEPEIVIILDEDETISASPSDLAIIFEDEDADPVIPTPPSVLPDLTEDMIRSGLITDTDRSHLLTDAEKSLIDNATVSSTPGTVVIRDSMGNIPGVTTGGGTINRHVYNQTSPASTWIINHNLNDFPDVLVLDSTGEELLPDIEYTNSNTIMIIHSAPYTGKVILT